ncbi:Unknown protein, partial [Striga hermonthica]
TMGPITRNNQQNQQQPPPPPPPPPSPPPHQHAPGRDPITQAVIDFRNMYPPAFTGVEGPEVVAEWLQHLESIFDLLFTTDEVKICCASFVMTGDARTWWTDYWRLRPRAERDALTWDQMVTIVMDCPDRYRVTCAQLQLTGDARLWWNAYWSMRPGEKEGCTWDRFKEMIREKYYPTYYRAEMERQFLSLKQGTRSVDEYEREFTRLGAFVPDLVRTEAQRAHRFTDGLYPTVRHNIVGHGTQTYARTVAIAQEVDASIRREANCDRPQPVAPAQSSTTPPVPPAAAQPPKGQKRKEKGAQTDRRTRQRPQQIP